MLPLINKKMFLNLQTNDIHIWTVPIDFIEKDISHYKFILSKDEIRRMESFKTYSLKNEYCFIRANLRKVLSFYLKEPPEQLKFFYNDFGKPYLNNAIKFNLSHTNDIAVIAVTKEYELGIDIEFIDEHIDISEVIQVAFSMQEIDLMSGLKGKEKYNMFYRLWTRKEALLKGVGKGLSLSPQLIDASNCTKIFTGDNWEILELNVKQGYKSSLAINCNRVPIKLIFLELDKDSPCLSMENKCGVFY
ncbi:4'-phosphopantetheinyl transferase family protein [Priestia megaterium]|uniref:4'-phosphopantetheinyl transferase family protein n=1 Tax=Priestia megaterium TaxID=1404 RepID=UPI001E161468|nr:4'-phosphopantetheinyl transferase superfamily protein [Priestia megaterium]